MLCAGAPGTGKTALGYHFLRETLVEFFQELNNSNNNNNTNNSNNNSSSSNSSSDTGNGNNDTINSASNHTTIKNHHTIALFCTLNNDTCFDEAFESTRHPESSLAWRMLLAYFGRAEFLRETASLTTLVALEFIAQYERKAKNLQNTHIAFGLVVDEFQKALEAKVQPKYDSEYAQLTNKNVKNRRFLKLMFQQLILNASSTFKKHNYTYYLMLCGTSLLEGSTCFSINTKDGSAFSCDTISPQLLTPKGVFSFASHSIKEGILWQTNTRIRYQLALSSGQPRALDHYFYRINTYGTTKDAEFLKVINTPKPGEEAFLGSFDRLIALSFLEVPVQNDTVYYEAEGIEWTVDHAVRIGFCTKIDTGESYRITVPYLNVVFYCEEISNKRKHQGAIYLGVVDNFKAAINELIQLFKSDSTPVTDFQDFEKCTACMVLIRRLSKLILALSNSAKEEFFFTFPYKELFNNISNKLDNIKIRMSSNTTLSQKALNKLQSTKDVQDLSKDDMFVCSQHQRAIDFVSILELEHGGSFVSLFFFSSIQSDANIGDYLFNFLSLFNLISPYFFFSSFSLNLANVNNEL